MNNLKVVSRKEVFNMPDTDGTLKKIEAERFTVANVVCFRHYDADNDCWVISHLESGCQISRDKTKIIALSKAINNIVSQPEMIAGIKEIVIKSGFEYPVNK